MKFVIYSNEKSAWRWRWSLVTHDNRRVLNSPRCYRRKDLCVASILAVKRRARDGSKTASAGLYIAEIIGWQPRGEKSELLQPGVSGIYRRPAAH